MPTYSYETNEQPLVRLNDCSGNIVIISGEDPTIDIETSSDTLPEQFHQSQRGIELNGVDDDLSLRVPRGATVAIDNADGDVQIRDVAHVELGNISGNVLLETVAGAVQFDDIAGDLRVAQAGTIEARGTASGDVRIAGATRAALEHIEGDAHIEDVPTVRLGHVAGDLRVNNATERCDVGHVEGDAACSDVGTLVLGHVGGDLSATRIRELQAGTIEGDCTINGDTVTLRLGSVGGDLVVRVATGTLTMGNVQGDASFNGALDQLALGTVQSDLALRVQFSSGGTYRAHVLGDAAMHLPNDANVTLHATVVGEISGAGVHTDHPTSVRLVWGAGEAALHLHVVGDLVISGPPPSNVAVSVEGGEGHEGEPGVYINGSLDLDMGRLGRDLANMGRELAASLGPRAWAGKRGRKGNWSAGVKLDPQQKEQIRQQVRAGVEQARASVDRALREARAAAPPPPPPPTPPAAPPAPPAASPSAAPSPPPRPAVPSTEPTIGATVPLHGQAADQPAPPDRDAERLAILRMVSEGTVTPAQAEDLLAALEG